jgi:CheY-like chemotaxis protein
LPLEKARNSPNDVPDRRGAILVVEDDRDLREMQSLMLRLQGYLVFEAQDGVEALAVLRRVRPDLILLDLQMPRMTGWQFLERLQGHPRFGDIAVCLVSAEPIDPQVKVAAVLRKPFLGPALLEVVRELCPVPVVTNQIARSLNR